MFLKQVIAGCNASVARFAEPGLCNFFERLLSGCVAVRFSYNLPTAFMRLHCYTATKYQYYVIHRGVLPSFVSITTATSAFTASAPRGLSEALYLQEVQKQNSLHQTHSAARIHCGENKQKKVSWGKVKNVASLRKSQTVTSPCI